MEPKNIDVIDQLEKQIEPFANAYREKNKIPENTPPARQLTDAELDVLSARYSAGIAAVADHPFGSNTCSSHKYWEKKTKSRL